MTNETVNRVLRGQATADDAVKVANWFQQLEGSMELDQLLDADLNNEWNKKYPYSSHHRSLLHRVLTRVAVCLLIVVGSMAALYSAYRYFIQPTPVTEMVAYAATGEHTQVMLHDGTRIFLNSESRISFPSRFNFTERRIYLEGEAYFEVSKNSHRPFIVDMDGSTITVLGTSFNVKAYPDEPVSVMLDEGSVVFSATNIDDVTLKPGELLCYDAQLASTSVRRQMNQSASAWRNHRIDVVNMPLAELSRVLERRYGIHFYIKNEQCYEHSFTLSMEDDDLKQVLKRMDKLSPLRFKYDETNKSVEVY